MRNTRRQHLGSTRRGLSFDIATEEPRENQKSATSNPAIRQLLFSRLSCKGVDCPGGRDPGGARRVPSARWSRPSHRNRSGRGLLPSLRKGRRWPDATDRQARCPGQAEGEDDTDGNGLDIAPRRLDDDLGDRRVRRPSNAGPRSPPRGRQGGSRISRRRCRRCGRRNGAPATSWPRPAPATPGRRQRGLSGRCSA